MIVYDIPNIEHCVVTPMVNGTMFKIVSNEEDTANVWKGAVILPSTYDFSQVEIRAEADLPEGAEICGGTTEPKPEVM